MLLHSLCYGSKCCSMLAALCWKSSGDCEDFKFWCGEEQERTWRMDIKQIFQPNLTEEFSVCTYGTKEENLVDVGKSQHTKMCRDQNCVGVTGAFWPKVPTFGVRGDMSPTCRHVGDFLSQDHHRPGEAPPGLSNGKRFAYCTFDLNWQHGP